MKRKIQDYFSFSPIERTGVIILLVILIILIAANLWLYKAPVPEKKYDYTEYILQVDSFRKSLRDTTGLSCHKQSARQADNMLFFFNPNTASEKELEKLGINTKIARRIISFRNKGGRFLHKEDLLKIYEFDSAQYSMLYPYITIPVDTTASLSGQQHKRTSHNHIIELNACDTTELKKLPGIGSVLALRIVKYRNLLGGFFSVEQLHEVYGISDTLIIKLMPYLKIDPSLINKIPVNESDKYQLSRHPYIGEYTARAIIEYRRSCGKIKTFEELIANKIIAPPKQEKIRPYLIFK